MIQNYKKLGNSEDFDRLSEWDINRMFEMYFHTAEYIVRISGRTMVFNAEDPFWIDHSCMKDYVYED